MLFTGGTISTVADLMSYESDVFGVVLQAHLERAQTEIGLELQAALVRAGQPRDLAGVVVTDGLKLWHTFYALKTIFRDAYNRNLNNDRYLLKWNEYTALGKWAHRLYFSLGCGLDPDESGAPTRYAQLAWPPKETSCK